MSDPLHGWKYVDEDVWEWVDTKCYRQCEGSSTIYWGRIYYNPINKTVGKYYNKIDTAANGFIEPAEQKAIIREHRKILFNRELQKILK